jgi:hypothetical protein
MGIGGSGCQVGPYTTLTNGKVTAIAVNQGVGAFIEGFAASKALCYSVSDSSAFIQNHVFGVAHCHFDLCCELISIKKTN